MKCERRWRDGLVTAWRSCEEMEETGLLQGNVDRMSRLDIVFRPFPPCGKSKIGPGPAARGLGRTFVLEQGRWAQSLRRIWIGCLELPQTVGIGSISSGATYGGIFSLSSSPKVASAPNPSLSSQASQSRHRLYAISKCCLQVSSHSSS